MPHMTLFSRRAFFAVGAATFAAPPGRARADAVFRVGGTGAALGGMQLLAPLMAAHGITLQVVRHLGTSGGIRAARAGAVHAAVAARAASPDEARDTLRSWRYAASDLVFATHPATSANSLSLEEAVALFAGRTTHWPGGERVRLSRRPDVDSDTLILAALSPAMAEAVTSLQTRGGVATAGSDQDQAEALELVPGTLGVIARSLVLSEQRALKILPLRDPPATGWPMCRKFYMVTRLDAGPVVEQFLALVGSEPASRILAEHGYAPARSTGA